MPALAALIPAAVALFTHKQQQQPDPGQRGPSAANGMIVAVGIAAIAGVLGFLVYKAATKK